MTNVELLEDKIVRSGLKKSYLAKKLGLSLTGFRNCCVNKAEFKSSHIRILCSELGITDPNEVWLIFFAKGVA